MKPQCCAKGQKHQSALQPLQDSLLEIRRYLYHDMKYAQCIISSVEISRYMINREYHGNTSTYTHACVHTYIRSIS